LSWAFVETSSSVLELVYLPGQDRSALDMGGYVDHAADLVQRQVKRTPWYGR
jgi:hypothetical protein